MTYCTPYLLRLGLTKSRVSLVWVAGPLSGLVMQPIIGIVADRSRSKWGRRRPYMVVGTVVVILCMLLLGWTEEVVSFLAGKPVLTPSTKAAKNPKNPPPTADSSGLRSLTVFLAVLSIYGVDFAINAVQASARSLIVDTLPANKQQSGSAWASRMVAIGHLMGYAFGAIDLRSIFGESLGNTQFKQLIVISCIVLAVFVGLTCWAVSERVLVSTGKDDEDGNGEEDLSVLAMFKELITTARNLPPRIEAICWIQFWAWIGWFPFLFYITTWIGEIYLRFNASDEDRLHPDSFGQMGRVGSTSLIIFSLITFACSMILPLVVESPEEPQGGSKEETAPSFTPRPPQAIAKWMDTLQENLSPYKPSLLTAWTYSHALFAGSMVCAPFVTSVNWATFLVAMCGL
jgi:solute carrier family 45, member 1/2/4